MSEQLEQPLKNDTKRHHSRKLLGWFAGIAAAIVSSMLVWWLTQTPKSPLVQEWFDISVSRVDYSSILDHEHEIVCFLKNSGSSALSEFSLEFRVWSWQDILSYKIDMYGDPDVCRLVNHTDGQTHHEFLYECTNFNPGESLDFSVVYDNSYYIKKRQTYLPAKVQVFLKTRGFTYNESIDTDEKHPILWKDDLESLT